MKKTTTPIIIFLLNLFANFSCTNVQINDTGNFDFFKKKDSSKINDHSSTLGGLKIELKYLTPQFLANKEIMESGLRLDFDSLVSYYSNYRHFVLSYKIDKSKIKEYDNLLFADISSPAEYESRLKDLNFHMEDMFSIKFKNENLKSKMVVFENNYGSSEDLKLSVLFIPEKIKQLDLLKNAREFEITYIDEIFNSGIHHFLFNSSDLSTYKKNI